MAEFNFGGTVEDVITSEEFSLQKAREILENETIAVLGYGVQGPGQALNLRDNGIRIIVGQREGGKTWERVLFVSDEVGFSDVELLPGNRVKLMFSKNFEWIPNGPIQRFH